MIEKHTDSCTLVRIALDYWLHYKRVFVLCSKGWFPRTLMIQPSGEMCTSISAESPGIGHTVHQAFRMVEERSELQQ